MSKLHLDHARRLAAVSGVFDPLALAQAVGLANHLPKAQDAMLAELSTSVVEGLSNGYGWSLRPDTRKAVLRRLVSQSDTRLAIEQAPDHHAKDYFAIALRKLLQQEVLHADHLDHSDSLSGLREALTQAGSLLEALQFAQLVPYLDSDGLEDLVLQTKNFIIETQRRQDMLVVLPDKHFGYDDQRIALSAFLRGKKSDFDVLPDSAKGDEPPFDLGSPVFVSGIGGVGKSALMARLFHRWQRRSDGPLTIVLDFDRRQLNTGSPDEMMREVLRQMAAGIHHKDLAQEQAHTVASGLSALRRDVGAVGTDGQAADYHSQLETLTIQLRSAFQQDWARPLQDLPIAMIFDSFEALDRRGGTNVETVLGFEDMLRSPNVLPNVRSVFSGRAEPLKPDDMAKRFGPLERRMKLDGLLPEDGIVLLQHADRNHASSKGVAPLLADTDVCESITKALKHHPMTLLMAVKFIHTHPGALNQLVDDLGGQSAFSAEVAQVFLYERVLDRIEDQEVRALAHPGLMLRSVNADMIRYVLATPCLNRQEPPSEAEAESLCDKLASEYWLVETSDQGENLNHRPDLREKMLPALLAEPQQDDGPAEAARKKNLRDKALDVCRAAYAYFAEGPPAEDAEARARWANLPPRFRRTHAMYYLSFLTPISPPEFGKDIASDFDEELGAAEISLMPTRWRIQIDGLQNRPIRPEDLRNLSADLYESVQAKAYQAETKTGRGSAFSAEFSKAFDAQFSDASSQQAAAQSAAAQERMISGLYAQARFADVMAAAPNYLEALAADEKAQMRLHQMASEALWQTPAWQIVLSAAALGPRPEKGDLPLGPSVAENPLSHVIYRIANSIALGTKVPINDFTQVFTGMGEALTLDGYRFRSPEFWRSDSKIQASVDTGLKLRGRFGQLSLAASGWPEEMSDHLIEHWPQIAGILQDFWELADVPHDIEEGFDVPMVTLRNINTLYSVGNRQDFELRAGAFARIRSGQYIARLFRGLTPEVYDPLENVLINASEVDFSPVLSMLDKKARFWPRELRELRSDKEVAEVLSTIIETTDRVGLMAPFLQSLAPVSEELQQIQRIHETISGWFFGRLQARL